MKQASPRARVAEFPEPPEWPEEPVFEPVPVVPALFGRMSLPLESAKRIVALDPANAFIAEAREVLKRGEHWIWT